MTYDNAQAVAFLLDVMRGREPVMPAFAKAGMAIRREERELIRYEAWRDGRVDCLVVGVAGKVRRFGR